MSTMTLEIPPYLQDRMNAWSKKYNQSPDTLAVKLFDEYFDDCLQYDKTYKPNNQCTFNHCYCGYIYGGADCECDSSNKKKKEGT